MSGLSDITKIYIPLNVLEFIYERLRESGKQGMECIALMFGIQYEDRYEITNGMVPKHKSFRTENGLLYTVDGDELHRINVWSYRNKVSLIAQIHSHPTEAFHSSTDDEYAIVTTIGGFSIVVPDFGFGAIDCGIWEVYRLNAQGRWEHLSEKDTTSIFEII